MTAWLDLHFKEWWWTNWSRESTATDKRDSEDLVKAASSESEGEGRMCETSGAESVRLKDWLGGGDSEWAGDVCNGSQVPGAGEWVSLGQEITEAPMTPASWYSHRSRLKQPQEWAGKLTPAQPSLEMTAGPAGTTAWLQPGGRPRARSPSYATPPSIPLSETVWNDKGLLFYPSKYWSNLVCSKR